MKTLTVKQPYASLIANDIKHYEFRTWKTKHRGYILIHAGKGINKKSIEKFSCYNLDYPSGAIIAKAELTDCIYVDDDFRNQLKKENPLVYSHVINDKKWQGYAFKLENIELINPIAINGKLSFWEYDYKE